MGIKDFSYTDLSGVKRYVTPSPPYKVTEKFERPGGGAHLFYSTTKIDFETPSDIVLHVMSLIASKPSFVCESSIPWLLAYLHHIQNDILCEILPNTPVYKINNIVDDFIQNQGSFIYVTRLASALEVLQALFFGMESSLFDFDSDNEVTIQGVVSNGGVPVASLIYDVVSFFEDKRTKSEMTKHYIGGTVISFVVPKGETYVVDFRTERNIYPAGTVFYVEIERFHKTQSHWSHATVVVGFWERDGRPVVVPLATMHSGHPVKFMSFKSGLIAEREIMSCTLYFPHDWIDAVYEYSQDGRGLVPQPVERHRVSGV
jgi:hypothetical protein